MGRVIGHTTMIMELVPSVAVSARYCEAKDV